MKLGGGDALSLALTVGTGRVGAGLLGAEVSAGFGTGTGTDDDFAVRGANSTTVTGRDVSP